MFKHLHTIYKRGKEAIVGVSVKSHSKKGSGNGSVMHKQRFVDGVISKQMIKRVIQSSLVFLLMSGWIFGGVSILFPKASFAPKIKTTHASTSVYTSGGATTSFTVLAGVDEIIVKAWGAGGAGGNSQSTNREGGGGGGGGFSQATITTTPLESLIVHVGGGGQVTGTTVSNGGGGGGFSGLFRSSTELVIAGGGAGGGGSGDGSAERGGGGGAGGASTGGDGTAGGGDLGNGGTQAAGGTGGAGVNTGADGETGETDGRYHGGDGGNPGGGTGSGGAGGGLYGGHGGSGTSGDSGGGGGGGSGYYGGGGAEAGANSTTGTPAGGGGGGSNFVSGSATSSVQGTAGTKGSTPTGGAAANTSDVDYSGTAGNGGNGGDGGAGQAGNDGRVVIIYASSTVTAIGTQTANMTVPSSAQYVGGAFVIDANSTTTVKNITISENGSVDAQNGLDNIKLRYDLDTSAPYDCASESYAAGDTQYGSTDTDGFSSANGASAFSGSVSIHPTQTMCVYAELDVLGGASGDLEVRIAASGDVDTNGVVEGTFALDIPGTTTVAVASMNVSGTCKEWDQTTNCSDTGTLRVAINGVLDGATQATVGGTWTISSVTQAATGDIITVFIDGAAAASNRAVGVTKYDGSENITGMTLFERHLVLGSDENPTLTNADLAQYDYSASTNDADIIFDVDGSNNLTLDNLGNYSDERLLVRTSTTYQPSAVSNVTVAAHHFQASTSATVTANGNTFNISGDWLNRGTFTQGTSTVVMSSTSASSVDHNGATFYNFTATGSAIVNVANTDFTVSNTLTANGTLDIASSRTVNAQGTITIGGTISGAGTLSIISTSTGPGTGGTLSSVVRYDATNVAIGSGTFDARTYGGLVEIFSSSSSATSVTAASGTYNFNAGLHLLANGSANITFDAGNNPTVNIGSTTGNLDFTGTGGGTEIIQSGTGTWTVSGNVDFTGGTYTAASGNTLVMNGTSKTLTSNAQALHHLTLSGSITLANAMHTINGDLDMTSGTVTPGSSTIVMAGTSNNLVGGGQTLNNLTIDPSSAGTITLQTSDVTVSGTLLIATSDTFSLSSGRTLTHSGSILTLSGTVSGAGRLVYISSSVFPTTGIISSILRFDSTNNNQTMSARTYGGLVEVFNNGTTNRILTMNSGTHTLSGALNLISSSSGNMTVDASSSNPTVTISGDLDFTGGGSGTEIIQSGTGMWSVGGNVDFTGGTYTTNTGNTLRLTGTGTLTSAGNTLQNLEFANTGTITLAAATHTIAGNIVKSGSGSITSTGSTVVMTGAGTNITANQAMVLNNFTLSPSGTITANGSDVVSITGILEVTTSTTLSINSGTGSVSMGAGATTLVLNGTISGAGRFIYGSTNAFPTTGTIASVLRFQVQFNNATMSARTYGGNVEVNNGGGSDNKLTVSSGTHIISGDLLLIANGSGDTTLDADMYDPTVNVSGNVDFIGTGGGTEIIQSGTGTWSVSGNVDFTAGTFTAASGNIFVMDGSNKVATSSSQSFYDLQVAGSVIFADNVDINNDFTIDGGTATSSSGTLTIGRNFTANGTFNHNSGTVVFDTSATSTVTGTTSWNSLTVTTAGKGIVFEAGVLQTINGVLTLTGASGSEITVQSSASGSQWTINHQGTESVNFIRLKDSGCHASSTNITTSDSINNGNNGSCWRFPAPDLTQIHYRWRNDDGNEANATFAAATDSQLSNWPQRTIIRLRMQISNEGTATSSGERYRIEYGELNTVCSAISTWVPLVNAGSASNQHWSLVNTSNVSDGTVTTDSAGIANENTNFVAGEFRSQTNLTSIITLSTSSFTELEWALWAEQAANNNAIYCFRATNNGSINDFMYSVYAQISVRPGGGKGPGGATEGSPPAATPTTGGTTQGGAGGSDGGGAGGGGGTGGGTGQGGGGGGTP